ncbi:MAG: hypothetical protein WA746_10665 [Isosphaeraceae bacterium]
MSRSTTARLRHQIFRLNQGEQADLDFGLGEILPPEDLTLILTEEGATWKSIIYTPLLTTWAFLSLVDRGHREQPKQAGRQPQHGRLFPSSRRLQSQVSTHSLEGGLNRPTTGVRLDHWGRSHLRIGAEEGTAVSGTAVSEPRAG